MKTDETIVETSTDIVNWATIDFGDGTTNMVGTLKSDSRVTFSLYQASKGESLVWGGTADLMDSIIVRTKATASTMQEASAILEKAFKEWCSNALFGPKKADDEPKVTHLQLTGELANIKYVDNLNRMFMLHRVFQPHMFSSIAFIPTDLIRPIMDLVVENGHGKLKKAIYIRGESVPVAGRDIDWDDSVPIEIEDEESGDLVVIEEYWSEPFLILEEGAEVKFDVN